MAVIRREDLLSLDFFFYNLALEAGGGNPPHLVRKDPNPHQPAYMVVQFDAPQNIAEQAYLETYADPLGHPVPPGSTGQNLTEEKPGSQGFDLPSQTRAAGPTRLALRLPSGKDALPFTLRDLLNWVALEPSIVPVAEAPDPDQTGVPLPPPIAPPVIRAPLPTETAIEAPWRLFLSPNYSAHGPTPPIPSRRVKAVEPSSGIHAWPCGVSRPRIMWPTRRSLAGFVPSGPPTTRPA